MLAASLPLMAALVWIVALLIDPGPYDDGSVFMLGFGLLTMATVATVGMILVGGRWALRTGYAVVAATFLLATVRPVDVAWMIGITSSAIALIALATKPVTTSIRKLPAATGPPERSVLLTLLLLGVPFALGLASWQGSAPATLVVALTAPLTGWWYSRVLPGGLYVARYLWPILAIGLSVFQEPAAAVVSAGLGITIAIVARDPSVKVAFYPPRERGTIFPIPPELAPHEILEAADVDEKGKRR